MFLLCRIRDGRHYVEDIAGGILLFHKQNGTENMREIPQVEEAATAILLSATTLPHVIDTIKLNMEACHFLCT